MALTARPGAGGERLGTKPHGAFVPVPGARPGEVGEHEVEVAHGEARTDSIEIEVGDPAAEPLDAVVEVDGRKLPLHAAGSTRGVTVWGGGGASVVASMGGSEAR